MHMTRGRLSWDGKSSPPSDGPSSLVVDEVFGPEPANQLIFGENLAVLAAVAAPADLVYIDPPFDSGRAYSGRLPGGPLQHTYDDAWGTTNYLAMLRPRLERLRDLLADTGLICVHIDNHAGNYVGVLLDEIFGRRNFVNEIIWRYGKMANATRRFANSHDRILVYAKSADYYFTPVHTAESEYRTRFARYLVDNKVHYGPVSTSTDKLILGRARRVARTLGRELRDDDVLFDFDTEFKAQDDVFYDISIVKGNSGENVGFHTQKPVKLLTRLIEAYCPPGGMVLDAFAGSGTTAVAAAATGRRFTAVDSGRLAIHTTRKRLLAGNIPFALLGLRDAGDAVPAPLSLEVQRHDRSLRLTLPTPEHIDYWAVDLGHGPGPEFSIDWHSCRHRPGDELSATIEHEYRDDAPRVVTVRAIDVYTNPAELRLAR
jgi:DNA modification methylase